MIIFRIITSTYTASPSQCLYIYWDKLSSSPTLCHRLHIFPGKKVESHYFQRRCHSRRHRCRYRPDHSHRQNPSWEYIYSVWWWLGQAFGCSCCLKTSWFDPIIVDVRVSVAMLFHRLCVALTTHLVWSTAMIFRKIVLVICDKHRANIVILRKIWHSRTIPNTEKC